MSFLRTVFTLSLVFSHAGLCLANTQSGSGDGFLTARSESLQQRVNATLQALLQATQRLDKIETGMWRSAQALPKNSQGLLTTQAVRYLVHGYFAQVHGWLIKGLGSRARQQANASANAMQSTGILQDKAPVLLEALLDARHVGRQGLSLRDAAAMAAALERLIVDESLELLEASYYLNGIPTEDFVDETNLRQVLMSFLVLWELGSTAELTDPETHILLKQELEETIGTEDNFWERLDEFRHDAVQNFMFERRHSLNQFKAERFSFQHASELVEILSHGYGQWQNSECQLMKQELMGLDRRGFGRVPLSSFYSQPESAIYRFGESVEYLREIGALDETHAREPHVLVANYVAGPSNCVAGSEYYSVCCLSECEGLLSELEGHVRAPAAKPEVLLDLVSNLASATVDAPRIIPAALVKRLHNIAEYHDGEVPLHGRLFAQWLHYVYPLECQYPHNLESEEALSPSYWQERGHSATEDEKERHIALAAAAADASLITMDADDAHIPQWSDEEVLPFEDRRWRLPSARVCARTAVQLLMLFAALRGAANMWTASKDPFSSNSDKKEKMPLHAEKAHFV